MARRNPGWLVAVLCGALLAASPARAADVDEEIGFERTPPRLAFVDGEVSFWRPGAGDWAPAQVNTALAAGDELYTTDAANLELQVGAAAFVRAGENTQLGLTSLEPDFLQLRVTEGHVSLDLRNRRPSQTVEIDTPNAAFTVEHTGYYRIEVDGETTTFTSRRGGRATVTTAAGASAAVAPSEQVVVTGADAPGLETYAAPELDAWDRWNYVRTDDQLDAVSARYVPAGVYGIDSLDHHGDWRLVPTYGAVWVPRRVPVGWAPYSTGRWMYDPYYGWTWVDDAPWGWAPYHYGRWVYVSGYWGWCPGRVVVRPYYSPALVAFYSGGGFSIGVSIGGPHVGWVALGWGEPLLPWWGPVGFRGVPRWAGWGGPRVVNKVVIKQKTVINVRDIRHYQNAGVRDAVVAVERDHFGRRSSGERRYTRADPGRFEPVHADLPVKPDRTSLVAAAGPARRPGRELRERSVVAVREPRLDPAPDLASPRGSRPGSAGSRRERGEPRGAAPPTRLVQPTREGGRIASSQRPPFGRSGATERSITPPAPRFEEVRREMEREGRTERPRRERPARSPSRAAPSGSEEVRGRGSRAQPPSASPPQRSGSESPARASSRPAEPRGERRERGAEVRREPSAEVRREPTAEVRRERGPEVRRERSAAPGRSEARGRSPRDLPGEPANRVYRQGSGRAPGGQQAVPRETRGSRGGQPRAAGSDARGAQPREGGDGGRGEPRARRGSQGRR